MIVKSQWEKYGYGERHNPEFSSIFETYDDTESYQERVTTREEVVFRINEEIRNLLETKGHCYLKSSIGFFLMEVCNPKKGGKCYKVYPCASFNRRVNFKFDTFAAFVKGFKSYKWVLEGVR